MSPLAAADAWIQAVTLPTSEEVGARLDALMAENTDATAKREGLRAAFHAAGERDDLAVARAVLDRVFTDTLFARRSPLHLAAGHGHLAMVQALIERGTRSPEAFLEAVQNQHWHVVRQLMAVAGAEATAPSVWGHLPVAAAPMDLVAELAQRQPPPSETAWVNFLDAATQCLQAAPLLAWALEHPTVRAMPLTEFLESALNANNGTAVRLVLERLTPTQVPAWRIEARRHWQQIDRALMESDDTERRRWAGAYDTGCLPALEGWAQAQARVDQARQRPVPGARRNITRRS